jgi:hypothetical protein
LTLRLEVFNEKFHLSHLWMDFTLLVKGENFCWHFFVSKILTLFDNDFV